MCDLLCWGKYFGGGLWSCYLLIQLVGGFNCRACLGVTRISMASEGLVSREGLKI